MIRSRASGARNGDATQAPLPFIDEHSVVVPHTRAEVWASVERAATQSLSRRDRNLVDVLWGTTSPGGFRVHLREPQDRITLDGSHRFSRYRLVLVLHDAGDAGTRLSALTYAAFDGAHGHLYRFIVISSRLHVVATRALLRRIARPPGSIANRRRSRRRTGGSVPPPRWSSVGLVVAGLAVGVFVRSAMARPERMLGSW